MSETKVFLTGVGITLASCVLVLWYLRPHLFKILEDLCQTRDRATFCTAFSIVTVGLVPVICALCYRPGRAPWVMELAWQIAWALVGLCVAVVLLGIVISRFISRAKGA